MNTRNEKRWHCEAIEKGIYIKSKSVHIKNTAHIREILNFRMNNDLTDEKMINQPIKQHS